MFISYLYDLKSIFVANLTCHHLLLGTTVRNDRTHPSVPSTVRSLHLTSLPPSLTCGTHYEFLLLPLHMPTQGQSAAASVLHGRAASPDGRAGHLSSPVSRLRGRVGHICGHGAHAGGRAVHARIRWWHRLRVGCCLLALSPFRSPFSFCFSLFDFV
jgi:hypothetical protein